MSTWAIIPAAGSGKRMGGGTAKQFLPLRGHSVLAHTLAVFQAAPGIDGIILAVPGDLVNYCLSEIVRPYSLSKVRDVVAGGAERQESVHKALDHLPADCEKVAVHDGVRPLLTPQILSGALEASRGKPGVVVAVPVRDTIKIVDGLGRVTDTPRRETLWAAQTPQIFMAGILKEAYRRAREDGFLATDDASLVERLGYQVEIFPGSGENLKITTPEDLLLAEAILQRRGEHVLRDRI